jgi:hypothetical protein
LQQAMLPLHSQGLSIQPIEPSLEDVFIALMRHARDNFGGAPS